MKRQTRLHKRVRNTILETLNGCEILSIYAYAQCVMLKDGQIIACGQVIDSKPNDEKLDLLWQDYFYQEFGIWPDSLTLDLAAELF